MYERLIAFQILVSEFLIHRKASDDDMDFVMTNIANWGNGETYPSEMTCKKTITDRIQSIQNKDFEIPIINSGF